MRKYLLFLLTVPTILTSQNVISTEKDMTEEQKYALTASNYDFYYTDILRNPNVFEETMTYKDANLTIPSIKLLPNTPFQIVKLHVNEYGVPIFSLKNGDFISADRRLVFEDTVLSVKKVEKEAWVKPDFKIYESPFVNGVKGLSTKLTSYSKVKISQLSETSQKEFAYIDGVGWINTEFLSEKDNRIEKVQTILDSKYNKENLSIYVKQIDNEFTAGVNQDKEMYSASVTKLLYLYYAEKVINNGSFHLDDSLKYIDAVNDFSGAYDPSGSGSLPKNADNKEYSVRDAINRTAKESDNVGSNLLGYYLSNQSDKEFQKTVDKIAGKKWNVEDRNASARMAGNVMESLYHQGGYVLEAMSETNFDQQRISKDIDVRVAHKIGDAYDYKHDVAIVYASTPFILSVFTDQSDYDTISQIAKDVYEVLK